MHGFKRLAKDNRGQAMVEFVVVMPALLLLLFAIEYTAKAYHVKNQTAFSARLAAWHESRGEAVSSDLMVRHYFSDHPERLVADKIREPYCETVNQQEQRNVVERFFDGATTALSGFGWGLNSVFNTSSDWPRTGYSVTYALPRNYRLLDLRTEAATEFTIRSQHFVAGNSWNGHQTNVNSGGSRITTLVDSSISTLRRIF